MGGIASCGDIVEFIRAGSSLVQIGTLNYKEPSIACRLYDELENFLLENKIKDINQLKGLLDD